LGGEFGHTGTSAGEFRPARKRVAGEAETGG
jgi:hypothetical protein